MLSQYWNRSRFPCALDLGLQGLQLVNEAIALADFLPRLLVGPEAARTVDPVGRVRQVAVDAGENRAGLLGHLRAELDSGPIGVEIGRCQVAAIVVAGLRRRPIGLVIVPGRPPAIDLPHPGPSTTIPAMLGNSTCGTKSNIEPAVGDDDVR